MQIPRVISKRLLTPKEAALYLGISERQLEYLRYNGQINFTSCWKPAKDFMIFWTWTNSSST
jgi:hypothetical protein